MWGIFFFSRNETSTKKDLARHRLLLGSSSLGLLGTADLLGAVLAFLALLARDPLNLEKTVLIRIIKGQRII